MKQRQYAQRRLSVGIAILSFLIGQVAASPVVIYDSGKTINAQQFYPFQKPSVKIKNIPRYIKKSIKHFPVVSSMLSIGKVKGPTDSLRCAYCLCFINYQSSNVSLTCQTSAIVVSISLSNQPP
jgi:hypothetical protein